MAELAFGLDVADEAERDRRAVRFRRVLDTLDVLPFGVEEAKLYGALAALVRTSGRNSRPRRLDLQIAATAAAARATLLTLNPRDFAGLDRLVTVVGVERPG